ncbi:glycosyltransferase family 2 protein [Alkalimarinus sediminis]|uniref:Glycosyltransferase n=1 Tax=Alkalimarinus sediminis TaxID=1632866 RepID=A0A9E8KN61_9ALTE|nr:glycosyltransferase [Alkalimarinus sediminis]UZW74063.1 glycosyltransferase [Alkalimarinus sediminis]
MLTIVIVSYNSFTTITHCLDELITSKQFSIMIVDNASPDGSGQKLALKYPNITLIQLPENLGYGSAANRALEHIDTKYSLLLNPDVLANSQLINNLLSSACSLKNFTVLSPATEKADFVKKGVVDKDWTLGAAMLFNMEKLRKVGFFDENFFLFFEETDLCYRIKSIGEKILLDSDIYIEHLEGQSSTPSNKVEYLKYWHYGWSEVYFNDKHDLNKGKKNSLRVVLTCLRKYLFTLSISKKASYKARFLGGLSYLRGFSSNKRL